MKKIYFLFWMLIPLCTINAQVLVSSSMGLPNTTYPTVKAAFDAVNSGGHGGSIDMTVTGNTIEVASAVLNASGSGSASYTSIYLHPSGPRTITGNVDGPLIDLNGADNLVIDGLNSEGSSLTVSNSSVSNLNNNSTIRFVNDATNNVVNRVTIQGGSTSTTLGTILFGLGSVVGNSNNKITNSAITDVNGSTPVNAIYSLGNTAAGTENANDTIRNNQISNFFNAGLLTTGVLLAAGNTSWAINNNRFFQTAARSFTTANIHSAIQITSGNLYQLAGNTIGFASVGEGDFYRISGAVATRFIGINLAVGTNGATLVDGNKIAGFVMSTTSGASTLSGVWSAISISSGDVNIGMNTGNTIGSTSGTGSITISPTVAGGVIVPINSSSTGIVNIYNNSVGAISLLPAGVFSGGIYNIQTTGAGSTINVVNNVIGNTTASNIAVGVVGTTTGNGIVRGIYNNNSGTVNITGNTIRNLAHNSNNAVSYFRGIEYPAGSGSISNNNISGLVAYGASTSVSTPEGAGILITSTATGIVVSQNIISDLSVTNSTTTSGTSLHGIYVSGSNGVSILANKIYGFSNASTATSVTAPGVISGIYSRDANAANPMTIANNMISFGSGQTTNTAILGIWHHVNSTLGFTARVYYNSVNIEGTVAAGAQPSFCYHRGDFSSTAFANPVVDIKNNIFTNTRTGGTGKHYAIANAYGATASSQTGWTGNASDFNILNANAATIGYWSGDQTFASWQTNTGNDFHSFSNVPVVYVSSSNDLHLVTTAGVNAAADAKAVALTTLTTDFDGNTRDATNPDIGADEFTQGPLSVSIEYLKATKQLTGNLLQWKAGCSSNSITFFIQRSVDGRKFETISNIKASQARCALPFDFADVNPVAGTNYYRLQMQEMDGAVTYSPIVAIVNKGRGFELVNLLPNIIKNGSPVLNIAAAKNDRIQIVVTDMSGKKVYHTTANIGSGSNVIQLNFTTLATGTYQLTGYSTDGETKTIRFLKQ